MKKKLLNILITIGIHSPQAIFLYQCPMLITHAVRGFKDYTESTGRDNKVPTLGSCSDLFVYFSTLKFNPSKQATAMSHANLFKRY